MKWEWVTLGAVAVLGLSLYAWHALGPGTPNESAMAAMDMATAEPAAGPVAQVASPTLPPGQMERMPNLGTVAGLTGIWAADGTMCNGGAWHIEDTKVVTDGEMSCTVERMTSNEAQPTTLNVTMRCTGEGVTGPEAWVIDTSAVAEGKIGISRNALPVVNLMRCVPEAS